MLLGSLVVTGVCLRKCRAQSRSGGLGTTQSGGTGVSMTGVGTGGLSAQSGTTATQSIIAYSAPDGTTHCTVAVSESPSYSPLVNDVNTTLFANSNDDLTRYPTLQNGAARAFVVGTVPTPNGVDPLLASDGYLYSRALHANTTHYYQITCGTSNITGSFITQNPQPGKTYSEPQPILGAGEYAFPYPQDHSHNGTGSEWSDPNWTTTDPVTGFLIKQVTLAGQFSGYASSPNTVFNSHGTCANWTNPQNVYASDSNYATYSGTTQDRCFISVSGGISSASGAVQLDSIRIYMTGHSTAASDALQVCPSLDGSTCAPGSFTRTIALPLSTDTTQCLPIANCSTAINPVDTGTDPPLYYSQVYGNANFGLLFWKTSNSVSTVSIDQIKLDVNDSMGPFWFQDGAEWPCATNTTSDSSGNLGYLCSVPSANGNGFSQLYWIGTGSSSGVVRWLGSPRVAYGTFAWQSGTFNINDYTQNFDTNDPTKIYTVMLENGNTHAHVVSCNLPASGTSFYNASQVSSSPNACASWTDLTPSPNQLDVMLTAFDSSFNGTKFANYEDLTTQGGNLIMFDWATAQDTLGWVIAYSPGSNAIKGAFAAWKGGGTNASGTAAGFRWCSEHSIHALPPTQGDWVEFDGKYAFNNTNFGGPYATSLTAAINSTQTTIPVASTIPIEPSDGASLFPFAVGDIITVDNAEWMQITGITGLNLTVIRGWNHTTNTSHLINAPVWAECGAVLPNDNGQNALDWWNYTEDPHGADTTGTWLKQLADQNGGLSFTGHEGWSNNNKLSESGYTACLNIGPGLACPSLILINESPSFAGFSKTADGNSWQKHPGGPLQINASGNNALWSADSVFWNADPTAWISASTNVSGSLWLVTLPTALNIKKLAILANTGASPLLDVSGSGSSIGGSSSDNYKFCIAYLANECVSGSTAQGVSPTQVYVNSPGYSGGLGANACPENSVPPGTNSFLCIENAPTIAGNIQIGLFGASSTGQYFRPVTQGLGGYRRAYGIALNALPDAAWALFTANYDQRNDMMMAQIPPWPTSDGTSRNDFIQQTVTLSAPGGTNNAVIEFGYDDSNFYCTSRQDTCVAHSGTYSQAAPFLYEAGDGPLTSISGVSCAASCSIVVPVIPGHVAYYRPVYRDASNNVLSRGQAAVLVAN